MSAGHASSDAAVSVARHVRLPGSAALGAIPDHRLIIHASPATWSFCRQTGDRHLRRQGDIDLVPAGLEGGFVAETPYESVEVRLAPALLRRVAYAAGPGRRPPDLALRHAWRNERIVHLANALRDAAADLATMPIYADAVAVAIATQILGEGPAPGPRRSGLAERQLRRLRDYIEDNLDQPLTIGALAREIGASSSHLRHWFKVATGETLHRYVMRRRVVRARALLVQDRVRLGEAAHASGFSDPSHMARWMRRELGATPRELLRRGTSA